MFLIIRTFLWFHLCYKTYKLYPVLSYILPHKQLSRYVVTYELA